MDPKTRDDIKTHLDTLRREGEERQAKRLADQLNLSYVDLMRTPVSVDVLRLIPEAEARDAKIASIEMKNNKVAVAAVNPQVSAAAKIIKKLQEKGFEVKIFVVAFSGLEKTWALYKFIKPEAEEITGKVIIEKSKIEELAKI